MLLKPQHREDERSIQFNARTYGREVDVRFTPLAKRFAKLGVDVFATVDHTGTDLCSELKRLLTLAFFTHSKREVDFFENWPADASTDRLFDATVEELEPLSKNLTRRRCAVGVEFGAGSVCSGWRLRRSYLSSA